MAAPTIIPRSAYYDGPVTESDRAKGRAGAADFTVYGADDLKLSAHPTIPFALVVKKGKASAYGVTAFVESGTGADLVLQCDPNTSGTRWDIITLRYDWRPDLGGPTDIRAINAGGKQVPSTLENTPGNLVDQPIWLVRWTGNASAPAEYIDLRCFAANGGMMARNTLALGYLGKPGARINVGADLWEYQDIGNQQWGWRIRDPFIHLELDFKAPKNIGGSLWGPGSPTQMAAGINKTASSNYDQFSFPLNNEVKVSTAGVYAISWAVTGFDKPTGALMLISKDANSQILASNSIGGDSYDITASRSSVYLPAGAVVQFNFKTGVAVTCRHLLSITKLG